jgi:hypothetical protein
VKDPWNVTVEELRIWAADAGAPWPDQDWNLAVARGNLASEVLRLATDLACPNRSFFLGVLYLFVGDAVRTTWRAFDQKMIAALLDEGSRAADASIRRWVTRSRDLVQHPDRFDYADWCDGGLARKDG